MTRWMRNHVWRKGLGLSLSGCLTLGGVPWSLDWQPAAHAQTPTVERAPVAAPAAQPQSLWQEFFGLPATQSQVPQQPRQPTQPASKPLPAAAQVMWEPLGRTVENRVIEFAQFGEGERSILVVGSPAGDQPEGTALAEMLAGHLQRFPRRIGEVTVTIVRDPNPDGRARRQLANARGVDLDRNFPTPGWVAWGQGTTVTAGGGPGSEPETRALVELLKDIQPDRVVLLGPSLSQPDLRFTGPAEPLARLLAGEAHVSLMGNEPTRLAGSLLSYCGDDMGIPTVRFGFTPRASAEELWSTHKQALLTAVGCGSLTEFVNVPPRFGPRRPPTNLASDGLRSPDGLVTSAPPAAMVPIPAAPEIHTPRFLPASVSRPPAEDPLPLRFEDLRQGLPRVKVEPDSGGRSPGNSPSTSRVERLPPVTQVSPAPASTTGSAAPSSYPSTGK